MPTLAEEFTAFWAIYPRRVSRQDAMKAYQKARIVATAEEILAGVQTFRAHMPDELRFVPYPATWLNAGRWMDEYEAPVITVKRVDWYVECKAMHDGRCNGQMGHHIQKQIDAGKAQAS